MGKDNENRPAYINREMSWLQFDERVLEEAADPEVPLLERLNFLEIFTNNLDEFFMIRVGTLLDQMLLKGACAQDMTGMTPREQVEAIRKQTKNLMKRRDAVHAALVKKLNKHNIRRMKISELGEEEEAFVRKHYHREIYPLLSPQIIDNRHPFPFLPNKGIYVGMFFENRRETFFGVIPAAGAFDRICALPGPGMRFVLVEDVICHYAGTIFGSLDPVDRMVFRVTRNADIITEATPYDDDIDFRQTMKELLKRRVKLSPVRLEIQGELRKAYVKYLCKKLSLGAGHVFVSRAPLDFSYVHRLRDALPGASGKKLLFPPLVPQDAPALDHSGPVMPQALEKDLLFSYPYETMGHLIRLVDEAAEDPDVVSIKITLYRVGKEGRLIRSLFRAAENGKEVLAVVELGARFDEEDNIEWATRLSEAGCRVFYGVEEFKVHSKVLLIMRKDREGIRYITQIGTGNYNERTARLYTDLSLVTADPGIGMDAVRFFNDILINNLEGRYRQLWVSPASMLGHVLDRIQAEIEYAIRGEEAGILAKMNALTSREVIDKLIEASRAGVRVRLIVRGICCLRPGVPGLTENVTVVSVVGRFLEHARVYCFGAGARREVYISSADWMTRNIRRRFEVACPVKDTALAQRVADMLELQLRDNVKTRVLRQDGAYVRPDRPEGEAPLDSQLHLYKQAYDAAEHPSEQTPLPRRSKLRSAHNP